MGYRCARLVVCPDGISGGATATGWAAQLQASYAPELHVAGFVIGGTPADMLTALKHNGA